MSQLPHFVLSDLVGHCTFPLCFHQHGDITSARSWLDVGCPEFTPKPRSALCGLGSGVLTAYRYSYAKNDERLRVVSDFMNLLFHLDNGVRRTGMEELADPVTNAVWFPERYLSTSALGKPRSEEECSAGKLARE